MHSPDINDWAHLPSPVLPTTRAKVWQHHCWDDLCRHKKRSEWSSGTRCQELLPSTHLPSELARKHEYMCGNGEDPWKCYLSYYQAKWRPWFLVCFSQSKSEEVIWRSESCQSAGHSTNLINRSSREDSVSQKPRCPLRGRDYSPRQWLVTIWLLQADSV